jgi:acyl-CoA thioesterase I
MLLNHVRMQLRFELPWRIPLLAILLAVAWACGKSDREAVSRHAPSGAAASAVQDPSAPPARPRIVALGDSLTAGYGLLESQSYPALLQQHIDTDGYEYEVVNAGVSGDTTAGGLRRLDWALEGNVRVLIVGLGGNDGLRGLAVAEMKQNLTMIVQRAKERGVAVILAGIEAPPNFGQEYATAFRQAFRDVALKERVIFIPFLLQNVAGRPELNQGDGIHPNVQGAAVVADTVWKVLRPVLDQADGS